MAAAFFLFCRIFSAVFCASGIWPSAVRPAPGPAAKAGIQKGDVLVGVEPGAKRLAGPCINLFGCTGPQHIFGLDGNVRDVFSRVLHGARLSLQVGVITVGFAIVLGTLIGAFIIAVIETGMNLTHVPAERQPIQPLRHGRQPLRIHPFDPQAPGHQIAAQHRVVAGDPEAGHAPAPLRARGETAA